MAKMTVAQKWAAARPGYLRIGWWSEDNGFTPDGPNPLSDETIKFMIRRGDHPVFIRDSEGGLMATGPRYRCEHCGASFVTYGALLEHRSEEHRS